MDSQINQNTISYKSDSHPGNESTFISRHEISKANKALNTDDELIAFLQNHRENRRARQVFEWEARRRETPNYL